MDGNSLVLTCRRPLHPTACPAPRPAALRALRLACSRSQGTLVAKIAQPGMDNRKLVGELGQGVDIVAVLLLSTFVGLATGSAGGSVGGLAGAGVI